MSNESTTKTTTKTPADQQIRTQIIPALLNAVQDESDQDILTITAILEHASENPGALAGILRGASTAIAAQAAEIERLREKCKVPEWPLYTSLDEKIASRDKETASMKDRRERDALVRKFAADVSTWTVEKLRAGFAQPTTIAKAIERDHMTQRPVPPDLISEQAMRISYQAAEIERLSSALEQAYGEINRLETENSVLSCESNALKYCLDESADRIIMLQPPPPDPPGDPLRGYDVRTLPPPPPPPPPPPDPPGDYEVDGRTPWFRAGGQRRK